MDRESTNPIAARSTPRPRLMSRTASDVLLAVEAMVVGLSVPPWDWVKATGDGVKEVVVVATCVEV